MFLENLKVTDLMKAFLVFYKIRRYITFYRTSNCTLAQGT